MPGPIEGTGGMKRPADPQDLKQRVNRIPMQHIGKTEGSATPCSWVANGELHHGWSQIHLNSEDSEKDDALTTGGASASFGWGSSTYTFTPVTRS